MKGKEGRRGGMERRWKRKLVVYLHEFENFLKPVNP